jgi:hypothetical protein
MSHTRRAAILGLAALIPAGLAGSAWAKTKPVEAGKLFPYLDMYLAIPAAQRSRFVMGYFLQRDGQAATGVSLVLLGPGGQRTPLPLGPGGRILRTPSLADLKAKAQVEITAPEGSKFSLSMEMLATLRPAATLDARELAATLAQCDAAIRSKAGLLGFAAPKVKRVILKGAGSGTAINAQGVARPLPMQNGQPAYDPEQMPGIVTLNLARAPSAILLSGRAK